MARRADIDMARGLAILLVVFGHLVARTDPAGLHWYEPLRRAVYMFHMPFFMYLSGLTAALSGSALIRRGGWGRFAAKRAWRLLLPFFAVGALVVLGKSLARRVMFVDHPGTGFLSGLGALFWHTADSPSLSIWYLFVLFVLSVAAPLFLDGDQHRAWILPLAGLALYVLPLPEIAYLDRVGRYAVFFFAGLWAGLRDERWMAFVAVCWRPCLIILGAGIFFDVVFGARWPECDVLLPAGLVSIPALHGLVRNLRPSCRPVFLWLGRYGFMIYLFNTMFIGLTKGVLLHFVSWDAQWFTLAAPLLMAAGVFGPVGLKHFGFARIRTLDRMTD